MQGVERISYIMPPVIRQALLYIIVLLRQPLFSNFLLITADSFDSCR